MALALGVSVAVAQTTVSYGTQGITASGNAKDPTTTTNLVLPSGVKNITIAFTKDNSGLSTSTSGDTMTIQGGGRIQTSILPVIQIKSDTGINLGDGLLKMDFGTANYATNDGTKSRYTILDLSAVKTGIAFQGNIELGTGSAATSSGWANENRFLSTFGGTGMQGNITIKPTCDGDGMRSDFTFLNGASLQGNVNVSGGTNYITFGTGDINGNIASSGGTTYITYGQGNKGLLSNGALNVRGGTLSYRFGENVSGSSRIFTLDTSALNDANSRVSVSGGSLVFDGVKQVILKNGDADTNGGEGIITLSGGSLQFNLDASAIPNTSNPVVKGNISVTNGTLIFKEKSPTSGSNPFANTSAPEPSKTYYVDGNIAINNGGMSIFWDDSRGFTAKLATTEGHNLTQTGGMIGKNDAWFAKGTFVEGKNKISLIQNYRTLSHLVFEDAMIIGEESNSTDTIVIDSQAAHGGTYGLQALFKEDVTINGRINACFGQGQSAYNGARNTLIFEKQATIGSILTGAYSYSNITFKGNTTIKGVIDTATSWAGGSGNATIVFSGQNNSIQGNIIAQYSGSNTITFEGTSATNSILGVSTNNSGTNNITFNGTTSNTVSGSISTSSGTNNINFNSTAANLISGSIFANGGTNNILFNQGRDNTISGSVTANGSSNYFKATNLIFSSASITAGTGGLASKNLFEISEEMNFNNSDLVIKSANTANTYTDKHNIFKFRGAVSGNISSITAITQNSNNSRTKNVLSFDGLANATTFTIGKINDSSAIGSNASGYNYIGANLTSGSGLSLALSFNENEWSATKYQADQLTLSITNSIYSKYGKNFINVGSLSVGGDVDGDAGHNSIATASDFSSNNVNARWGGRNNLVINGNTTITTSLLTGGSDNGNDGYNTLTLNGATNTIGSITSQRGSLTMTLNHQNASLSVSGGITSAGGSNGGNSTNAFISTANLTLTTPTITAGKGNNQAKNLFDFRGDVTFGSSLAIIADNTANTTNEKNNIFKFGGNVNFGTYTITELTAKTQNSNQTRAKNILSFDGGEAISLTIGDINKSSSIPTDVQNGTSYASGNNYIGKNLTSGSGTSLALKSGFNDSNWNSQDYQANVNLTVSGTILAKRQSVNYINVASLSAETITNDYGTNNINTSGNFQADSIVSHYKGTNNILVGGNATIKTISTGLGNSYSTNNLTLYGDGSSSVVSGNIVLEAGNNSSVVGKNNITLSGNNATLTLQGETNQITNFTAYATPNNTRSLGYSTLVIDGSTHANNTTIGNVTNGENLVVKFNGTSNNATLKISSFTNGNTLKAITLGDASTHNTLDLTALDTITITDLISVGENQGLNLNLLNTSLTLTSGLTTGNGASVINVGDTTTASASSTLLGESMILKTLNLNGATDSSTSTLTLSNDSNVIGTLNANAKTNTLQATKGETTISNAISVGADKTLTLSLSTSVDTPHDTVVKLESAISGEGSKNIEFTGGINPADQIHHATLLLKAQDNQITSVSSSASNGVIAFQDTAGATIGGITISSITPSTPSNPSAPSTLSTSTTGGSLTFAFRGAGASQVTTNGITVGNGATLGISLGVTDASTQTISGNIDFQEGSTLLVDFLDGNKGNATITTNSTADGQNGTSGISIGAGRNSIINFHGTNEGQLNGSGITIDGGNNTINFIGSATMSGVTLSSGTNTINVYGAESQEKAITGTIISSQLGNINNTINLNDCSILNLLSAENSAEGSGELKTTATNTLNFLGNNATLKGGFGADAGGTAKVNVGRDGGADTDSVSGTIIGEVSNATLAFNAGTSKLTLQNLGNGDINHTFATITSNAKDGILVFDTSKGVVNATISNGTTINEGKSLSLDFQGENNTTVATNGGLTINGTLGIIINGDGEKKVTSDINLNGKGTLLVDFTSGTANVTLGQGNGITIAGGESSIINFRGGAGELKNSLTLNGGTNTLNFFVNGDVGGIELVSGSNTINVEDGITAKILDTSSVGSVNNTINLKEGAKLYLQADGSGSLNTTDGNGADGTKVALSNSLNFNGANATLYGGFGIADDAISTATINVKNTGAVITGNVSNAGVSFSENSGSTLTLQGENNTLNALGSTTDITGTIILDTTLNDSVSAEITSAVASDSSVGLKFGSGNKKKTFTFSAQNNTLSGVEFDENGSTNNALSFTKTGNSIVSSFEIADNQGLTIDLQDGSDLSIAGLSSIGSGVAKLQSTGTTTLKGGSVNVASLSLLSNTSNALTLQNSNTTIDSLSINATASDTLKLDATNNAVYATINDTLNGNNLAITLAGNASNAVTLSLQGADNIINTLSLDTSSTNNTLTLAGGKTTIGDPMSVDTDQEISFNLASGTTLAFGKNNAFENLGSATFNIQGANTTLDGAIDANDGTTALSMSDGSSLTLTNGLSTKGGTTTISLVGTSSITGDISTTSGDGISTTLNYAQNNASLTLKSGTQQISSISLAGATNNLGLENSATSIKNDLTLNGAKNISINVDKDSSLTLANVTSSNGTLTINGNGEVIANNITSSSTSGSNTINVETLTINGSLAVSGGSINNITAQTLSITGDITGDSTGNNTNANNIVATNLTLNSAHITAGTNANGWGVKNRFDISGDATFSNASLVIKADSTANAGGVKHNIFRFGGNFTKATIAEVTTTSRKNNGDKLENTANILSFDGLTQTASLTIGDINKTESVGAASGYNYIGKNLTSGSGESLALSFTEKQWNSNNHTANLDLKVTGNVYAKTGKNFINVRSFAGENQNTITADGGVNKIATASDFSTHKLVAQWGGTNEIIIGGNGTIDNNIEAGTQGEDDSGNNNISFVGSNTSSVIKGDILLNTTGGRNNLALQGSGATLTLQGKDSGGTTHAITTLNASGENTTLVLDNSADTVAGAITTTINTLSNGANLTAILKGKDDTHSATLILKGDFLNLKALALGENSSGNILDLSNAISTSIADQINIEAGQELTIKVKNASTLNLVGGANTSGGVSKLKLADGSESSATLRGGAISLSDVILSATDSNTLYLSSSSAIIDNITASGSTSNTLALGDTHATITSAINVSDSNSNPLSFDITNSTLVFGSSANTITSLSSHGGLVDLSQGVKLAESAPSTDNSLNQSPAPVLLARGLVREGEESGVVANPDTQVPPIVDNTSSTDVNTPQNPSVDSQPSVPVITSKEARNTLTINNGFTGTATFKLYASSNTADRVVFKTPSTPEATPPAQGGSNPVEGASLKTTPTGTAIIAITGDSSVYDIKFDENGSDNIMVADTTGANGSVAVEGGESMIGVSTAVVNLVERNGQYFIGDVIEGELNQSLQAIASSALAVNYDLYLANFNSLNKRMGELRNNEDSNGIWARVFGGNMSNSFGAGSKTDYITAQAGYDYSLSVGNNARNFTGIAVAYGTSNTKSNTLAINAIGTPFANIALDKVSSNMVEVGVYNSYVADSGWYNDTIFKFDYIMSEFSLSNDPSTMSKTNNFAMVLSDEFGYRYSFGENEKGSWYIDPQAEFAFGYFNQSDFNRAVLNSDKVPANLQASQDAILTLRSRVGATLGKKFITDKGFASLYVGASYEYDYIEGGNSEAGSGSGKVVTQLDKVESNGRAVLNVGSNIELTKGARLYIDVEKSFGDKQRTFMQFNLGARYSF